MMSDTDQVQENIFNAEVLDKDIKECYTSFTGAERIHLNLKKLTEEIALIPEAAHLLPLANSLKFDFGRMVSKAFQTVKAHSRKSALNILKNTWKLYEKNPSSELLYMLNKFMGISQTDLAVLTGVSQVAINSRIERYISSLLPNDFDPEGADEDEKADVVMAKLYRVASSNKIDRESINAAKVFLELYNKKVERSAVQKWRQVEIIADFFFSRLVPAIHQELVKAGASLDIRSICLPLFEGVSQEVAYVLDKLRMPEAGKKKKGRPKKNES
jgi:hypothetical protein